MADMPMTTAGTAPRALLFVPKRTKNMQIDRLVKHFGSIAAADAVLPDDLRFVFLCFTQRSGSTYLAQLIGSSGDYNVPREYFNPDTVITRAAKRNLTSFADYIGDLVRSDAKQGRIFFKITPLLVIWWTSGGAPPASRARHRSRQVKSGRAPATVLIVGHQLDSQFPAGVILPLVS